MTGDEDQPGKARSESDQAQRPLEEVGLLLVGEAVARDALEQPIGTLGLDPVVAAQGLEE